MNPKYLTLLAENKLRERVEALEAMLASCTICPKDCGNDRLKDEIAACYSGRLPIVSIVHRTLWRRAVLVRHERRRKHLLRQLQSPLRLLPELSDLANLERAEKERDNARASGRDDARTAGSRLSQHRFCLADAFRSADGPRDIDRRRKRPAAADRLQHERLRFGRGVEVARRHRRCLSAGSEICRFGRRFSIFKGARLQRTRPSRDQRNASADGRRARF